MTDETVLKKTADAILNGKTIVQRDRAFAKYLRDTQRKHIDKYIRKISDTLYVEHDKCISRKKCIRMCPVSNITEVNDGIVIGDNYAACMRCYHFCPTNAVNITAKKLEHRKMAKIQRAKQRLC